MAIFNPLNVAKVIEGVDDEVARLLKGGVTAKELEDAKVGYLKQEEVERTSDASLAAMLSQNLYLDRTMKFDADLDEKIRSLSLDAVNQALRKHIDPRKFSVVTAGSFKKK
jgi:zinc protease